MPFPMFLDLKRNYISVQYHYIAIKFTNHDVYQPQLSHSTQDWENMGGFVEGCMTYSESLLNVLFSDI